MVFDVSVSGKLIYKWYFDFGVSGTLISKWYFYFWLQDYKVAALDIYNDQMQSAKDTAMGKYSHG